MTTTQHMARRALLAALARKVEPLTYLGGSVDRNCIAQVAATLPRDYHPNLNAVERVAMWYRVDLALVRSIWHQDSGYMGDWTRAFAHAAQLLSA